MNSREQLPEVMTVDDIQKFLGIGRNTAYDLLKRKPFPIIKFGRTIRINRERFLEWFDKAG